MGDREDIPTAIQDEEERSLRAENARLRAAAAHAAHRINNLLMPIGGALDVAHRRCDDPRVRAIIEDALQEVEQIAALASGLEREASQR